MSGSQRSLRPLGHQIRVALDPAHEHGHGCGDAQVDVEELRVAEVGLFR